MIRFKRLTERARHVLANLDRVIDKPYSLEIRAPHRRSQLDNIECTDQITSLIVRGLVDEDDAGNLCITCAGELTRDISKDNA